MHKHTKDLYYNKGLEPFDFRLRYLRKLNKVNKPPANYEQVPIISNTTSMNETSIVLIEDPSNNLRPRKPNVPTNSFVNTTVNYLIPSTSYQPNYQHGLHRSKRLRRSNAPEYISAPAVFKNIGNDYDFQRSMTSSKVKKETAEDINRWIEETEYKNALAQANSVINIKVHWRQMGTYRFPLRMSLSSVYKHIAKLEGVDPSHVRLYRNQRILSPKDTLDSIKYKITDAIEGDITFLESPKCTTYTALGKEELVTYKITRQAKSPIIVKMRKTDKMSILYIKLKELLGIKLDSFTLKLNGDKVKYSDTMASLGLEGDNNISLE